MPPILAIPLNFRWEQPLTVCISERLVADHALCHQASERLIQIEISNIAQGAGKESRIEKMKNSVFDTANILIDGHPIGSGFSAETLWMLGIGEAQEIPGAFKECVESVLLTDGRTTAGWAACMLPSGMIGQWIAWRVKIHIFWQGDRQIGFRHRNQAAAVTVNDRNGTAPVTLARYPPVTKTVCCLACSR